MFLVRFALILFIIFIIIRLITRFVLQSYIKNVKRNFEDQQNKYSQKKEGDITINSKPSKDKKFENSDGDYVDFEEVD